MTVRELIELLQKVPQDSMVVVPGYEGGYDNPKITTSTLIPDANWGGDKKKTWYNGRHDEFYEMDSDACENPVNCIVVGRE